jgi:hypothetical protein
MEPFARTIDAARKYVVSSTLQRVDWNAELVRGDLGEAVRQLKRESGKGLYVGGVTLALALTELGLIDEYEFAPQAGGPRADAVRGAVEARGAEAREPAGVRGRWPCGMRRDASRHDAEGRRREVEYPPEFGGL